MTLRVSAMEYRRLRAPREHGQFLCEPELWAAGELLQRNRARAVAWDYDCQGQSLVQLRGSARECLLRQAQAYTSVYREVDNRGLPLDAPLVLAGHQPWLFHPGVWFKNVALSAIGRNIGAFTVNLLIDNDVCPPASLRVPSGTPRDPYLATVLLDGPAEGLPFESRQVLDESLFASFGGRVEKAISPLVSSPLVKRLWPYALEASRNTNNLGRRLAQARHLVESDWGLETLEIPLSDACQSPAFSWFSAHLLAHLPRFWEIHNVSVGEYRRTHRIRSRSHPVPDLVTQGDWIEAPLWIYTDEDPHRRRLFARLRGNEMELTDRQHMTVSIPLTPEQSAERAVEKLDELARGGIRLRPRALVTTMFSRLCLSDLFLHGIGGAKYDQLTDVLIERFFGVEPPDFMTLTATAWLPIPHDSVSRDDLRRTDQLLRELRFHPERHVQPIPEIRTWVDEKQRWIESAVPANGLRERHLAIERANRALQPYVAETRSAVLSQRDRIQSGLRRNGILTSREHAFCLFPEAELRQLLLGLCADADSRDG